MNEDGRGWTDGRTDGRIGGRTDGWTDVGRTDGWTDVRNIARTDRQADGRKDYIFQFASAIVAAGRGLKK